MQAAAPGRMRWQTAIRAMLLSIVVNAVCPSILFAFLSSRAVPTITALTVTAVFPLAGTLFTWARAHRVDGIGLISLIVIAIGILVSVVSDKPRLYLVKDSFLTGGFAAVCLGSLLLPRPLVFHLWGHFAAARDPQAVRRWSRRWSEPAFRRTMRLFTLAWAVAFGADALFRVPLALYPPPSLVLLVNPIVTISIVVLLAIWMVRSWRALNTAERRSADAAAGASRPS